jgi:O-antigen/teichoic acid export membrane protein
VAVWTSPQPWIGSALVVAGLVLPFYAMLRLQGDIGHALSWFTFWNLPNNILRPLLLLALIAGLQQFGWLGGADMVMALHALVIVALLAGQTQIFRRGIRDVVSDATPVTHDREWLRVGAPLALVATFNSYFGEVNVVAAGPFMEPDDLAVFNVTYRTGMFLSFFLLAVDQAQLPRISRLMVTQDKAGLSQLVHRGTRTKSLGTVSGLIFLALAGQFVLGWFGDPRYVDGYGFLMALSAGFVARAMIGNPGGLLNVSGHQDRCVVVFGLGLLATGVLDMALVPAFGPAGAVATVLIVMLACDLTLHWMARQLFGIRTDIFAPRIR